MKRFISFFLSVLLCFSLSPNAKATNTTSSFPIDRILAQNAINSADFALSFVANLYPGTNWCAGNVITIYNENDAVGGFCIDIINGTQKNGYVVVKFANNEPVVSEFCIEPNVNNPFTEIIEQVGIDNNSLRYYSIGPNDYHILDNSKNIVIGIDKKSVSTAKFNEYKRQAQISQTELMRQVESRTSSSEEDFIVYSGLDGYSVISNVYTGTKTAGYTIAGATNISYYDTDDVDNNEYIYACSLVALSNLMKYYRSIGFSNIDSDFQTVYSELWAYAGTNTDGGTATGNIAPAAEDYLADQGYNCSASTCIPTFFSTFTNALDADNPCTLSYGATFNGIEAGHTVFVVGHVTTTEYKYLKVADGWNSSLRFINYNGYNYSYRVATTFSLAE